MREIKGEKVMDNVVRLSKLVKNIGLVTTAVFGVIVIATFITGHIGAGICFMPLLSWE